VKRPGGDLGRRADRSTSVLRAGRAGRILDHGDLKGVAQSSDCIDACRDAALVDGDHGRVRGVRAASIVAGVRLPVCASTSAKTGLAPTCTTTFVVAMNEKDGTTTSSPVRSPPRSATGAAPWCSWTQRLREGHRRRLRTAARTRLPAVPARSSPTAGPQPQPATSFVAHPRLHHVDTRLHGGTSGGDL